MEKPILTRGAIVYDDIYVDDHIIYGPGFVKAYQMEENCAKYPRIIIAKETIDSSREKTDSNVMNYLWATTFRDFDEYFVVNYFDAFCGFDTEGTDCSRIYEYIETILATSVDSSIREKHIYIKKNLLKFYTPNVDSDATECKIEYINKVPAK